MRRRRRLRAYEHSRLRDLEMRNVGVEKPDDEGGGADARDGEQQHGLHGKIAVDAFAAADNFSEVRASVSSADE